jgi:hypothetical protein
MSHNQERCFVLPFPYPNTPFDFFLAISTANIENERHFVKSPFPDSLLLLVKEETTNGTVRY